MPLDVASASRGFLLLCQRNKASIRHNVSFTISQYPQIVKFPKLFRANPVKLGRHYKRQQKVLEERYPARLLITAASFGFTIGLASLFANEQGFARLAAVARPLAINAGLMRAREPQSGDYWLGCNDARRAGTAPIYSGEPGYRDEMDGDSDGIACEPYY